MAHIVVEASLAACSTGCTLKGRHLADCNPDCPCTCHTNLYAPCDTPGGCHEHHDGTACRGCLPKPIPDSRTVCQDCETRLTAALDEAPHLVAHIRSHIEPGPAPTDPDRPKRHGKAEAAPAPLSVAALSDADDLHALLASWAVRIAASRRLHGPSWAGSDVRPASKRRHPIGAMVYEDARVVGVRYDGATRHVTDWLRVHIDHAVALDDAADLVDEIASLVGALKRRWPDEEPVRWLPRIRCPKCHRMSLRRSPPKFVGQPVMIHCSATDCGKQIAEELWAHQARLIEHERRERKATA